MMFRQGTRLVGGRIWQGCQTSGILQDVCDSAGTANLSQSHRYHSRKPLISSKTPCTTPTVPISRIVHGFCSSISRHMCTTHGQDPFAIGQRHVSLNEDGNKMTVEIDGMKYNFHTVWLRQNCHCSSCKQQHSGQRMIRVADMNPNYTAAQVEIKDDSLMIRCIEEDDHVTVVPLNFLQDNDYSTESLHAALQERTPEVIQGPIPDIQYAKVMDSDYGKLKWMQNINNYGICILKNVPTHHETVMEVAEMIAPIQSTIYGQMWDVISTPKPINVAYSDADLDFHMDLVYYESPPGVQFLHCVRFDECIEGGESVLVDALAAAEDLRRYHPSEFNTLVRVPATFQKIHFDRDRPVCMEYKRPHVVLTPDGVITAVNWAPAFEGPLNVSEEDVEAYYKAYTLFAQILDTHHTRRMFRLEPGDLLGFNNRRILHARNGFKSNGGIRHLQGCYVNIDEFKSQVMMLQERLGIRKPVKRVGNNCWM